MKRLTERFIACEIAFSTSVREVFINLDHVVQMYRTEIGGTPVVRIIYGGSSRGLIDDYVKPFNIEDAVTGRGVYKP